MRHRVRSRGVIGHVTLLFRIIVRFKVTSGLMDSDIYPDMGVKKRIVLVLKWFIASSESKTYSVEFRFSTESNL